MKESRLLITFIFVLLSRCSLEINAQCPVSVSPDQQAYMDATRNQRNTITESLDGSTTHDIPIQIHVVRKDDGTGGAEYWDIVRAINDVNEAYAPVMNFSVCHGMSHYYSINYIDSTKYFSKVNPSSDLADSILVHNIPNVVNIYFMPNTDYCGWAPLPNGVPGSADYVFMDNSCIDNGSTLSHELGHYFNLYHTHSCSGECENVARTGPNKNCGPGVGDELCDTPADPKLLKIENGIFTPLVSSNCEYLDDTLDVNGELYEPSVENIMSYSWAHCRDTFTPQQFDRMVASYLVDHPNLECVCLENEIFDGELVNSNINVNLLYKVSDYIHSTTYVHGGAGVTYSAGNTICLQPGFHAEIGSEFLANIQECSIEFPVIPVRRIANNDIAVDPLLIKDKNLINYPNPFSSQTTIAYNLEKEENVSLTVYDLTGKVVDILIDNELQSTGSHTVPFDGSYLGTGIYFYALQIGDSVQTQKMILTK